MGANHKPDVAASPIAGHLFESDIKPLRNVDIFSRPSFEDGFLVFLPDDIATVANDTVSLPWHEEHKSLVVYKRGPACMVTNLVRRHQSG
jgi:hypothetical protein